MDGRAGARCAGGEKRDVTSACQRVDRPVLKGSQALSKGANGRTANRTYLHKMTRGAECRAVAAPTAIEISGLAAHYACGNLDEAKTLERMRGQAGHLRSLVCRA